ncbi:MFS transporter [Georgenia sp. 10Sc9-8]|uniref:MFS transporter n=1 Tax=Georgenia halotolerans TaxID=3028317 RepID=A0ABT5U142_9MICO|nr:MFS transporter [Georgenia halotolerans]
MATLTGNRDASTWSLVLLALFFGLGQNIIKPIIAPQTIAVGGDSIDAGVVVAAQGIGGLLAAIPTGRLLYAVGGRAIVAIGAVVFAGGAALMAAATGSGLLALGHFLLGMGGVGAWLAAQTMATVASNDDAARRKVARVSTAALIGMLAGPPLGGLLADLSDVRFAFIASFILGVLLLPVALALPPGHDRPTEAAAEGRPRSRGARLLGSYLWQRPGVLAALFTSSMAQALLTIRQSFLPLHLEAAGWSATQVGAVLSIAGVGALGARTAFTMLDRRVSASTLMIMCTVPGALALGTAVIGDSGAVVVTSMLISGFALGLSQPVTLLMLSRATTEVERGPAVGQRIAGNRLMQAVAPVMFGMLTSVAGLVASFWAFAVLGAVGGIVVGAQTRRRRG